MIHDSGIGHSEIEMEFDRMLMKEDYINPVRYLPTGHIHPSKKNAEVIAPFFENMTPELIEKCMKGMLFCLKTLHAPNMMKRRLLFGGMKLAGQENKKGMVMSLEPNPACRDYCRILKRQYAGAVPLAAGLIIRYQKTLFEGKELPEVFGRTFGPGEDWEQIRLQAAQ